MFTGAEPIFKHFSCSVPVVALLSLVRTCFSHVTALNLQHLCFFVEPGICHDAQNERDHGITEESSFSLNLFHQEVFEIPDLRLIHTRRTKYEMMNSREASLESELERV